MRLKKRFLSSINSGAPVLNAHYELIQSDFFKGLKLIFLLLSFSITGVCTQSDACITYGLSGGRLGDNLLSFAHAKWVSYMSGLPLVYQPFPYSDALLLSQDSSLIREEECIASFHIAYYPEPLQDSAVNWDDADFICELRSLIAPIASMPSFTLPQNRVSVALHIRTGIGIDPIELPLGCPLKCPSFNYYIDALELLSHMLAQPLYVFIFTDHPNPMELKHKLAYIFSGYSMTFDCRNQDNRHDKNVLQDFFALGQFDCLIRPESNYSLMASKLFAHQIVISPLQYTQGPNGDMHIDKMKVQIKDPPSRKTVFYTEDISTSGSGATLFSVR